MAPIPTAHQTMARSVLRCRGLPGSSGRRCESQSPPATASMIDTAVAKTDSMPSPRRTAYKRTAPTPAGTSATPTRPTRNRVKLAISSSPLPVVTVWWSAGSLMHRVDGLASGCPVHQQPPKKRGRRETASLRPGLHCDLPLRLHDLLACFALLDRTASTPGLRGTFLSRSYSAASAFLRHFETTSFFARTGHARLANRAGSAKRQLSFFTWQWVVSIAIAHVRPTLAVSCRRAPEGERVTL